MKKFNLFPMILAAVFFIASVSLFADKDIGSGVVGLALTALFVLIAFKKKKDPKSVSQSVSKKAPVKNGSPSSADEYKTVTFAVAGVTFANDNGSSRQKILRQIVNEEMGYTNGTLEEYEYDGEPAIRVLTDLGCVGNIHKEDVAQILAIADSIYVITVEAESFKNVEGKTIYRADVSLRYKD